MLGVILDMIIFLVLFLYLYFILEFYFGIFIFLWFIIISILKGNYCARNKLQSHDCQYAIAFLQIFDECLTL